MDVVFCALGGPHPCHAIPSRSNQQFLSHSLVGGHRYRLDFGRGVRQQIMNDRAVGIVVHSTGASAKTYKEAAKRRIKRHGCRILRWLSIDLTCWRCHIHAETLLTSSEAPKCEQPRWVETQCLVELKRIHAHIQQCFFVPFKGHHPWLFPRFKSPDLRPRSEEHQRIACCVQLHATNLLLLVEAWNEHEESKVGGVPHSGVTAPIETDEYVLLRSEPVQ
mmetsp:Transcript_12042/g.17395  ORF Transcript_12042/g.17395 Transcript_12042/m.17395 type:complete len:220 (-) Transcript_12042:2036-2695(-)